MKTRGLVWATAIFALMTGLAARGEVRIISERNVGDQASSAFKFKTIPSASRNDAATKANFAIVDGARDWYGGELDCLNDGRIPRNEDDPRANLFFAAGTDGGRLAVDLGAVIEVKQVNTYSWHSDTRGPQVYVLYGREGGADFNAQPKKGTDPEKHGWKRIAAVDTRPKQGDDGGQYGVSISDSVGALGKLRCLLFDVSRTDADDPWGNTFFSEIDVIDAAAAAAPEPATTYPSSASATRHSDVPTSPLSSLKSRATFGKYSIYIDYSEAPELKSWIESKLKPTFAERYPRIVNSLHSEGFTAPEFVEVRFVRREMPGPAVSLGLSIHCSADWFIKNRDGGALGAIVHELVHIVQCYRDGYNPLWLVEGVADYIRWFQYEPPSKRPRPTPNRAKYTDSYRTTGAFLNYVVENHDKGFIVKINAAMREGRYKLELWKEFTGKTVDELWDGYVKTLK